MTATACTAWVAERAPGGDHTLSASMATGANLLGLALGPPLSGLLAQYEPAPLRLPYLIYLIGLVVPALIDGGTGLSAPASFTLRGQDAEETPRR